MVNTKYKIIIKYLIARVSGQYSDQDIVQVCKVFFQAEGKGKKLHTSGSPLGVNVHESESAAHRMQCEHATGRGLQRIGHSPQI